jgi:hypothetical protein
LQSQGRNGILRGFAKKEQKPKIGIEVIGTGKLGSPIMPLYHWIYYFTNL